MRSPISGAVGIAAWLVASVTRAQPAPPAAGVAPTVQDGSGGDGASAPAPLGVSAATMSPAAAEPVAPVATPPGASPTLAPAASALPPVTAAVAPAPPAEVEAAPALPHFQLYGFARLDAVYATHRMYSTPCGFWALGGDAPGADDPEFQLYARWTRLGLDVAVARPTAAVSLDAKVEIDFNNAGTAAGTESRATPRMRHAYATLAAGDLQVLAGQTWDLFAPLLYGGMEQVLFWYGGNLGDRRPQLRLTYAPELGRAKLVVAGAAVQSGAVDMADLDQDGRMDGIASAHPGVQGLLELQVKVTGDEKRPLRLGVSGHYAQKRFTVGTDEESFPVAAGVAHVVLPVGVATLQAEGFIGENLTDVRGGIGQGIELHDRDGDGVDDEAAAIPAKGGFVQAQVAALPWYTLEVGAGVDNPRGVDPGGRGLNQTFHFGNAFKPYKALVLGAVYDHYRTTYVGPAADGISHRFAVYTMIPF
jgi:hypothetical protein